jgi:hypothetical protein
MTYRIREMSSAKAAYARAYVTRAKVPPIGRNKGWLGRIVEEKLKRKPGIVWCVWDSPLEAKRTAHSIVSRLRRHEGVTATARMDARRGRMRVFASWSAPNKS